MDLHEALNLAKFDQRLIQWHLNQGVITKADIDAYLKSLPDSSSQSIHLDFSAEDSSYGNGADQ